MTQEPEAGTGQEPNDRTSPAYKPALKAPPPAEIKLARLVCLGFTALFLLLAFLGPKPWDKSTAKRIAEGRTLRPQDYAASVFLPVTTAGAVGTILLALTAGFWARRPGGEELEPTAMPQGTMGQSIPPVVSVRRRLVPLLIGLTMLLALVVRWPLASGSLWWDEIWTLKNAVNGYAQLDESREEGVRFVSRDWAQAAWYFAKPTNHVGFSLLSKAGVELEHAVTGGSEWEFSEPAFRWPSLFASMAAVGLMAWVGGMVLGPWGGLLAALLLALHPWFVRYGVDGRAFGLNVFLSLAAVGCWMRMVMEPWRWRWVVGGAAAALAMLICFPYNLFLPLGFCLVLTGAALLRRLPGGWRLWGRNVAALSLAALLFLPVAAPWVPQALEWTDVEGSDMAGPRLNAVGLYAAWVSFTTGMPVRVGTGEEGAGLASLEGLGATWAPLPALVFWGLLAAFGFGLVSLLLRKGGHWAVRFGMLVWLVALALPLVVAFWKQHYFYERYLIYALPAVLLALLAGIRGLGDLVAAPFVGRGVLVGSALTGLFAIALLLVQSGQLRVLLERPIAPMRDVALFMKEQTAQDNGVAIGYGLGGNIPAIYHPAIDHAFTPVDLAAKVNAAVDQGRPVWLFYGYSTFSRKNQEGDALKAFRWIDNTELFEPVTIFRGIEEQFFFRVLRHTGKRLDETVLAD